MVHQGHTAISAMTSAVNIPISGANPI